MRKGWLTLLAAAREVVDTADNVHFVIVGQRYSQKQEALEYERQVHAAADSGPLRDHVHFLGVRSDVDRLLNEFTLLAHPARQEPLGRVLHHRSGHVRRQGPTHAVPVLHFGNRELRR